MIYLSVVIIANYVFGEPCPANNAYDMWTPCAEDGKEYILPAHFVPATTFSTTKDYNDLPGQIEQITPVPIPNSDSNPCDCGGLGLNATWKSEDDTSFGMF